MSAIGILGGMGPQASSRLYELLIDGTKAYTSAAVDNDYPEIVLLNVPVPNFVSNKDNLPTVKQMLIDRIKLLEKAGCVVNGIACNTAHILLPDLQAVTKVPFLSIPELVAEKVKASGFERIGLLASPTTLASTLYDEKLPSNVAIVRPTQNITKQVEKAIYQQLNDNITKFERREFRRLVRNFKTANNLDAVILGCTELPLLFGPTKDKTIIDTLQLLADGLLEAFFDISQPN